MASCLVCRTPVKERKDRTVKYCSHACYGVSLLGKRTSIETEFKGKPKVECRCIVCGFSFMEYQSRIISGRGKTCSYECRNKRISRFNKEERDYSKTNNPTGENNYMWKGDEVGYGALHDWVKRTLALPFACGKCEEIKKLTLANISGEYKRDVSDWIWLCYSCHRQYDHPKNRGNRKNMRNTFTNNRILIVSR